MGKSTISVQAENYAEVIVGQIVGNFTALNLAVKHCPDFKKAQKKYDALDDEGTDELTLKTAKDKMEIIQDTIGSSFCSDEASAIEPLAVGLFGEWGSGKTHQLKLIQERIKRIQTKEYAPRDNEATFPKTVTTIPVFFNAWRFEKEEHIILPLFQTLLDALENYERTLTEKGKRALKPLLYHMKNVLYSIHKGIKPLSLLKTIKGVVTGDEEDLAELSNIVDSEALLKSGKEVTDTEQVNNQTLTQLLKPDPLQSIYLNIPQWIEKITLFENVNFVFLIDDLDRCLPENTLKMLESIKLFLDVPSCAFVLAVDDDVVERGVVHHYRDYLSIYHNKDAEDVKSVMQHELPITGHEYLEKMIQLPIRLPVIDTVNAKEFLASHSQKWIAIIDKKNENKENQEKGFKESDKLLTFFANTVPAKPRKLIRTAKLFETKLLLLNRLLDEVDMMFVAKLTLLELFSPKLLRFIQNQGYGLIFNRLCHFREARYQFHEQDELENSLEGNSAEKPIKKFLNSLTDKNIIFQYISATFDKQDNIGYTTKEQNILKRAMKIVDEHYSSRVAFDLDVIFDKAYDTEKLKLIVELQEVKDNKKISVSETSFSNDFLVRLFRDGDVDAWKDTLKEHDSMISTSQLEELMIKAQKEKDKTFNNLPFISNPEWVGVVAEYLNDEAYKVLLKASHDIRFKTIKDKIQIDMFTVTFSEYDKYCEIVNIQKPKDEGWGRGRRPVIFISINHVENYIKWLSERMGYKYFLPTENQWNLYKGEFQRGEEQKNFMWSSDNSNKKTHRVGELKENEFGIYDTYGNVWEWGSDFDSSQADNKKLFGGSWKHSIPYFAKPYRLRQVMRKNDVGFRLLRTLP